MRKKFSRREAIKTLGAGMATLGMSRFNPAISATDPEKKHFITLSFDDGFKKSSIRTAEIFEKHHLKACINVIATAHLQDYKVQDDYQHQTVGDFGLWNELAGRGHEIMMHGYRHDHLDQMSAYEAKDLILKCIDYFAGHLNGFDAGKSIFNFPYNASTPELESWLPGQVMAFRTGGPAINSLPHQGQTRLTCVSFGPGNIDTDLENQVNKLLSLPSGWMIYNTHGLDDEGWGPVSSLYLDHLLGRLEEIKTVEVVPAGMALRKYDVKKP